MTTNPFYIKGISIKSYSFDLFDKKIFFFVRSDFKSVFSNFFDRLNNLEDWDSCYDDLLKELISIKMEIKDPIQIEKLFLIEKNSPRYFSTELYEMSKIKNFYFVEKRNKIIENILKN